MTSKKTEKANEETNNFLYNTSVGNTLKITAKVIYIILALAYIGITIFVLCNEPNSEATTKDLIFGIKALVVCVTVVVLLCMRYIFIQMEDKQEIYELKQELKEAKYLTLPELKE